MAGAEQVSPELDRFAYRVLLDKPVTRTIPIFALGVEARLGPVNRKVITGRNGFSLVLGRNLSRVVECRYGPHRLIDVRRRVGERTAMYSSWLAFPDLAATEAFLKDQPGFGLASIEAQILNQIETRTRQLNNGVAKGRYEFRGLSGNMRLKRARFYVDETAALDRLDCQLRRVRILRKSMQENQDGVSVG